MGQKDLLLPLIMASFGIYKSLFELSCLIHCQICPVNALLILLRVIHSEANIGLGTTIVRRFQDSLSIAKQHKCWKTRPVGQFKEIEGLKLPGGLIEPPAPLSTLS